MKTALYNCHGKLRCEWQELRCDNPLPGAVAATVIQSCAFDTLAMVLALEMILLPESFQSLREYPDCPLIYANSAGQLLWPSEDVHPHF